MGQNRRVRSRRSDLFREDADGHVRAPSPAPARRPAEPAPSYRGTELALERPANARREDVVALQRLAGNAAVQRLAGAKAAPAKKSSLAPGPYTGTRKVNEQMDWFEDNKNIFPPAIFQEYGKDPGPWAPLASFFEIYFVRNHHNLNGLSLNTPEREKAAWTIIESHNPGRLPSIREEKSKVRRLSALLDAILGQFDAEYRPAHDRCIADWRKSGFRLFHEWLAAHFKRVSEPYSYWAGNGE
jgi:hypothetical protein